MKDFTRDESDRGPTFLHCVNLLAHERVLRAYLVETVCGFFAFSNVCKRMVSSQVQATAQPIKVPQFIPPPRLTPRPTFLTQVRPRGSPLPSPPQPLSSNTNRGRLDWISILE